MATADEIFKTLIGGAATAFGKNWTGIEAYAKTEFQKMATQLADIAENVKLYEEDSSKGYSPETGKALLKMQRTACESVIVAMTHLTLIAVQASIDKVFETLESAFGGIFKSIL